MVAPQREMRSADLRRVFSDDKPALHAHAGRIGVLLEDLRIEFSGITSNETMPGLEELGRGNRKQYFIRRSFATLYEFIECLNDIKRCDEFAPVKAKIDANPRLKELWEASTEFFAKREIIKTVTDIRHNMGGHFGHHAARGVIQGLAKEVEPVNGNLEIYGDPEVAGRAGVHLFFTEVFAAQVIFKDRGDNTAQEHVDRLRKLADEAHVHAIHATHVIMGVYLVPRFRELGYPNV